MSEEDRQLDFEVDRTQVQSALDAAPDTAEPRLSMLDEWSRSVIMQGLYTFKVVDQDGVLVKVVDECKYPDVERAAAFALSHLNMLVNYTWTESRAAIMGWRGRHYEPLRVKYRREQDALDVLAVLNSVFYRATIGGSSDGSHQRFISQLMGGNRKLTIERGGVQQ